MSKIGELLKLIPKGFKNFDKIVEGWTNDIRMEMGDLPEEQVAIIIQRRLICAECPFNSKNAVKLGFLQHTTHR